MIVLYSRFQKLMSCLFYSTFYFSDSVIDESLSESSGGVEVLDTSDEGK